MADLFDDAPKAKKKTIKKSKTTPLRMQRFLRVWSRTASLACISAQMSGLSVAAEILDNAMDEAVTGKGTRIDLELAKDQTVMRDNGRGIPTDRHPKFESKSALSDPYYAPFWWQIWREAYETSGGLHGVGLSVVNALSDALTVEVARDKKLWTQSYARGIPTSKLTDKGKVSNRRGTTIHFHPDPRFLGPIRTLSRKLSIALPLRPICSRSRDQMVV